jgi:hypothetical protein
MTKEVAFLHKDSKSLIEADLLFNLPPKEQVTSPPPPSHRPVIYDRISSRNPGRQPFPCLPGSSIRGRTRTRKSCGLLEVTKSRKICRDVGYYSPGNPASRAMKKDAKTIAEWDFERIIPCHGVRVIVALRPITPLTVSLTGRNREGRKQSVEGSIQVVSRVNALLVTS